NGQFFPNKEGFIVNAQGYRLTGYEEGGTNIVPVRVPTGNIAPLATTTMWATMNVDANADVIPIVSSPEALGYVELTDAVPATTNLYYRNTAGTLAWFTDAAGTTPAASPSGSYTTGTPATTVNFTA